MCDNIVGKGGRCAGTNKGLRKLGMNNWKCFVNQATVRRFFLYFHRARRVYPVAGLSALLLVS
jgi:hypothetical protein